MVRWGGSVVVRTESIWTIISKNQTVLCRLDKFLLPAWLQEHNAEIVGIHMYLTVLPTQTAAGKTFTMAGDLHNYVHRGVIPRSIHHVFQEIDMRVDKLYKVRVALQS